MVSVIITTKNEEKNLERLLRSLDIQTYKNIEVIIVDNNSSDKTKEIAGKYTKKVYDKGPERSAQRNFGAKKSRGEYLLILDADMELTPEVIENCLKVEGKTKAKALIVPEKTVGSGFIARIRSFEREMYMGDLDVELARFINKKIFFEFGGYDLSLTGPEDYDLFYRIKKKYKVARAEKYIYHHEEKTTLSDLLKKKFYYAKRGAGYANKHPELIWTQGTIILRKIYLKNWKKFFQNPIIGVTFILVRFLEAIWAVSGYISAVGFSGFIKALFLMFKYRDQK